jgi:IS605 OrfB family transposase
VQQALSVACFHDGEPLGALALHRARYRLVLGPRSRQMPCSVSRLTAAAYAGAKSNGKPAPRPFAFRRARALPLVGRRGHDADFRADGTLATRTVAGRQRLAYVVPDACKETVTTGKEIDCLTVIECDGRLLGRVTLTLRAPVSRGIYPVGIDPNETNALVAADLEGRRLFASGRAVKVRNKRDFKSRKCVQQKHAARKAEHKDTRSARRLRKRLGRKRLNRTRTVGQTAAKQLIKRVQANAVLVFEAVTVPHPTQRRVCGNAVRRRLSAWQRQLIRQAAERKAQEAGVVVAEVNPAYTSQTYSRCGLRGIRQRYRVAYPSCGHEDH